MFSNILVPLDIDAEKTCADALALARELMEKHQSKLTLLHVNEVITGMVAAHLPADFAKKAAETALENLKSAAAAAGLADKADCIVLSGNPASEILEHAKNSGADTIVIASHEPGLADYLIGSVAGKVVRHAHCSVLVVRNPG